jgi:ribonuclease Z
MNILAGGAWMFDCGEGTVRQMISSSVRAGKLDSVFITHLHGDHVKNIFILLREKNNIFM